MWLEPEPLGENASVSYHPRFGPLQKAPQPPNTVPPLPRVRKSLKDSVAGTPRHPAPSAETTIFNALPPDISALR